VRGRLRELTGFFAVEVHSYSVMSNHLHVVVRNQPDWVKGWKDEEVARRWLWFFPGPGGTPGQPAEPDAIRSLCRDREKLALLRERLADLSWFMRCLNEHIARRANAEDDCTGRFWEGRFKCDKLSDEGAALACMSYVDLNPVRAGMADSVEASDFTSAQDRLMACRARRQLAEFAAGPADPTPAQAELIARARVDAQRDAWLAPIGLPEGVHRAESAQSLLVAGNRDCERNPTSSVPPTPSAPPVLASTSEPAALLTELSAERYLELIDWTGREIRSGKRGRISPDLAPVLERLDLDVEAWVGNIERYGGLFYRLAGKLKALRQAAAKAGLHWLKGQRGARLLYDSSS
jgi:REP element-mobilizing transposase RayT